MDERFCYCICICNSSVQNSELVTGENSEFCYVFRVFDPPTRAPYCTLKSTFCHCSTPNRNYSKNKVYPRIKHDVESLKYNMNNTVSGNTVKLRIGCCIGLWAGYEPTTLKSWSSKGINPNRPIIPCMRATRKTMAAFGRKNSVNPIHTKLGLHSILINSYVTGYTTYLVWIWFTLFFSVNQILTINND